MKKQDDKVYYSIDFEKGSSVAYIVIETLDERVLDEKDIFTVIKQLNKDLKKQHESKIIINF